jgi:hypothetical protein
MTGNFPFQPDERLESANSLRVDTYEKLIIQSKQANLVTIDNFAGH